MNYYNEHDPYAAEWLRNLMFEGHIPFGFVDERDIRDVRPDELTKYTQCHFFAGIGVWAYALRQAGWPDDRPIWTGSCPCQPFSAAGARGGETDERHLWPHWFWLVDQCRPSVVLGEQVASKDGLGWLDLVSTDLEGAGYAFGASDLCAAGFSGAHIRQRLYFVGLADTNNKGLEGRAGMPERADQCSAGSNGMDGGLANSDSRQRNGITVVAGDDRNRQDTGWSEECSEPQSCSDLGWLANSGSTGRGTRDYSPSARHRDTAAAAGRNGNAYAPMLGWHPADWLFCRDGKWRPVEPGTFPLADAAPARVGRLRAYGNALDAETATNFAQVVKDIVGI